MKIFYFWNVFIIWLIGFTLQVILYCLMDAAAEDDCTFQFEKPLEKPVHQFPLSSRANKVRTALQYDKKPYWPMQWYMTEEIFLVSNRVCRTSMNIAELHKSGVKGENVGVVIIGNSPVNCKHEEIHLHCNSESPLYSFYAKAPFFTWNIPKNQICVLKSLPTAVAGIIGMSDEGQYGGVGIAPKCTLGNIVIEPSQKSGSPEYGAARILSRVVSPGAYVFVHAWVLPYHDYKKSVLHALGDYKLLNFHPERQLRPHVMGSGDHGLFASSCQCNEYANTDLMFVFGSVAYNGFLTPYSETCASLIGVTYSASDGNQFYNNIVTVMDSNNKLLTYAPKGSTTVSAAIGGGIIALISNIFNSRFYRSPSVSDIAFLLAFSSSSKGLTNKNMLWFKNGVGLNYSPQAGFGLPNMKNILQLLRGWVPVGLPTVYEFTRFDEHIQFRCRKDKGATVPLTYRFNLVCFFKIANVQTHRYIQLVTIKLSAKLMKRGALSVYLISPAGTVSCILEGRPYDIQKKNYNKLYLRTNQFIGEKLEGQWSIRFYTYKENSRPTLNKLYSFPTRLQSTSWPLNVSFRHSANQKSISSNKAGNSIQELVNFDSVPAFSSGNLHDMGSSPRESDDNIKSNYKSVSQISKSSANPFTQSPCPEVNPPPPEPPLAPNSSQKYVPPTSSDHYWSEMNFINQINFRFVLVENLPPALNVVQSEKTARQRKIDFELIKAWVDFRHFLLIQTDPQNFGTSSVGLWEVNNIMNYYIQRLLMIQKKSNIYSLTSIPPSQWRKLAGSNKF